MKKIIIGLVLVFGFLGVHASEAVKGIKKDYTSFKEEMQLKLNATENKIEELKKKAGDQSTQAQEKSIKEYEEKRDQLKVQLDEMGKAGQSKWQKAKKRMAESIDKLNKKVQKSLEE